MSIICLRIFVGAGISTLMTFSDGLCPSIFCPMKEKMRPLNERMNGEMFVFRQSWLFLIDVRIMKVLFLVCTWTWRVNNCPYRLGKTINRRKNFEKTQ